MRIGANAAVDAAALMVADDIEAAMGGSGYRAAPAAPARSVLIDDMGLGHSWRARSCTRSISRSVVKPCANTVASVQPSELPASISSARCRSALIAMARCQLRLAVPVARASSAPARLYRLTAGTPSRSQPDHRGPVVFNGC
jgi:hypothetical protein